MYPGGKAISREIKFQYFFSKVWTGGFDDFQLGNLDNTTDDPTLFAERYVGSFSSFGNNINYDGGRMYQVEV